MNFLQHCSLRKNLVTSLLEPFLRNCLKVSKIVLEQTGDFCRENCKDQMVFMLQFYGDAEVKLLLTDA